ncbi:hypothetical protein [Dyella telluris]|uniref:Uncharacterized protein n=1 Tax=Dyella telluris TaxID=2763498 RepID=A0A7G8Q4Q9_9GAMM|nr:hypothetical protein [Dyella telluris]QNK01767.1 hypothetical protein H8F01_00875 [Dyella telluris]
MEKFIDPNLAKGDLNINPLDLDAGMMRQAGLFAYYAEQAARAEHQASKFEHLVEVTEAKLDRKYRDEAAAMGTKATEGQIKAKVSQDTQMKAAVMAYNEAKMIAGIAKGYAEAFRHRKDMLIQAAFNKREEMKGEVRVLGDSRADAARELRQARAEALSRSHT